MVEIKTVCVEYRGKTPELGDIRSRRYRGCPDSEIGGRGQKYPENEKMILAGEILYHIVLFPGYVENRLTLKRIV
jgi:hypothetical protein